MADLDSPQPNSNPLKGIEFEDPVEMLLFLDDDLLAGHYSLYPWQIKILKDFAKDSSSTNPYQGVVRAANGSGKDKYIISACCVWIAMRYPNTVCVVTSASGEQLDRQTNKFIKMLAESANKKFGYDVWKINYRHYECNFQDSNGESANSTVELFVTDEAGRAEGWHPVKYNSHLAIFTSESKSIPDLIFQALARCTGFTKRLDVSSPGLPMGHFFNRCTSGNWNKYHITAYECPHISKQYIEDCRIAYGGEGSTLFKSMILAEFGTTDEQVIVPYHAVWNCIYNVKVPHFHSTHNTAGLDLAAGGDETVLTIRNGNKVIKVVGFRESDTAKTINRLEVLFRENGLQHPDAKIYGDAGGLGKPMLDQLKARGWNNIRYVVNQGEPKDKRAYYNRGTENWFHIGKLIEGSEIILLDDERLKRQLSTRYYKQTDGNKLLVESKIQAKAKGHPSPDRADSLILAFSDYKSILKDVPPPQNQLPKAKPPLEKPEPSFSLRETYGTATKMEERRNSWLKAWENRNVASRPNYEHLKQLVSEHNEELKRVREKDQEIIS